MNDNKNDKQQIKIIVTNNLVFINNNICSDTMYSTYIYNKNDQNKYNYNFDNEKDIKYSNNKNEIINISKKLEKQIFLLNKLKEQYMHGLKSTIDDPKIFLDTCVKYTHVYIYLLLICRLYYNLYNKKDDFITKIYSKTDNMNIIRIIIEIKEYFIRVIYKYFNQCIESNSDNENIIYETLLNILISDNKCDTKTKYNSFKKFIINEDCISFDKYKQDIYAYACYIENESQSMTEDDTYETNIQLATKCINMLKNIHDNDNDNDYDDI